MRLTPPPTPIAMPRHALQLPPRHHDVRTQGLCTHAYRYCASWYAALPCARILASRSRRLCSAPGHHIRVGQRSAEDVQR